jgi:hypothetical protein
MVKAIHVSCTVSTSISVDISVFISISVYISVYISISVCIYVSVYDFVFVSCLYLSLVSVSVQRHHCDVHAQRPVLEPHSGGNTSLVVLPAQGDVP